LAFGRAHGLMTFVAKTSSDGAGRELVNSTKRTPSHHVQNPNDVAVPSLIPSRWSGVCLRNADLNGIVGSRASDS